MSSTSSNNIRPSRSWHYQDEQMITSTETHEDEHQEQMTFSSSTAERTQDDDHQQYPPRRYKTSRKEETETQDEQQYRYPARRYKTSRNETETQDPPRQRNKTSRNETGTQDEHQYPRQRYKTPSRKLSSKTRKNSKHSSSAAVLPHEDVGDGGNTPPPIISEQLPIRCPSPSKTKDLAFEDGISSFEERTEYYEERTWNMYNRILNYRTTTRRDNMCTTCTTKQSSTTFLPLRRHKDLQIEENNNTRGQIPMLASTAIDQDTCMEEIFDLEL